MPNLQRISENQLDSLKDIGLMIETLCSDG